jgi:phage major head subunit gpT-like protein
MIINPANLELAFKGFKTVYTDAYNKTPVLYENIAMTVPSSGRDETYGWIGQFPRMREWLTGERQVKDLEAFRYTITNRKFESTVSLQREDFADDRFGVFKPMFAEMGQTARQHPDELIFSLLATGFSTVCFDGQFFFDTDHPSVDAAGAAITVSNMQAGTNPAWFLFDTSRFIKPMIWQEREAYQFDQVNRTEDTRVFLTDVYLYGIRARVNAGFGLWQLAFGSRAPLTAANYVAARNAMGVLRGDRGRLLGIKPNVLVVPRSLEEAGRTLLKAELSGGGNSNIWAGSAELIVSPYL